jgi:hypothetical protein
VAAREFQEPPGVPAPARRPIIRWVTFMECRRITFGQHVSDDGYSVLVFLSRPGLQPLGPKPPVGGVWCREGDGDAIIERSMMKSGESFSPRVAGTRLATADHRWVTFGEAFPLIATAAPFLEIVGAAAS